MLIPWQLYPTMQRNASFLDHLQQAGLTPETPIYFICRSGARSLAAAQAAAAAGYKSVYNVADGFEGPPDSEGPSWTASRVEGHRTALGGSVEPIPVSEEKDP